MVYFIIFSFFLSSIFFLGVKRIQRCWAKVMGRNMESTLGPLQWLLVSGFMFECLIRTAGVEKHMSCWLHRNASKAIVLHVDVLIVNTSCKLFETLQE